MKSLLVVTPTTTSSSSSTSFNENFINNNKENINDNETITHLKSTTANNFLTNSNSSYDFINISNNLTDKNSLENNSNANSCSAVDFQKLKRSHAIQDIQAMDDYSPVTYETSLNTNTDFILEEDKLVVHGIKIRAGKIQKLIQILIESFGKSMNEIEI